MPDSYSLVVPDVNVDVVQSHVDVLVDLGVSHVLSDVVIFGKDEITLVVLIVDVFAVHDVDAFADLLTPPVSSCEGFSFRHYSIIQ